MEVLEVLSAYTADCRAEWIEPLDTAGGFSGARLWRVETPSGGYCLRQWPKAHPSEERLNFIHAVLLHAYREGCDFLPVPRRTRSGETFLRRGGFLWELTPWMPGQADFRRNPTHARLGAALATLARFHQAAATFPGTFGLAHLPSPGIEDRLDRALQWKDRDLAAAPKWLDAAVWPDFLPRAMKILALARETVETVQALLRSVSRLLVPLQPCIRDVWHDHVLFDGDRVSGLIDFGAMRIENVAADFARLLGSLVHDDPAGWQAGLEAYQTVRALSNDERKLIVAFDRSTVLLSGLQWIDWIYRQGKTFPSQTAVLARIDEILSRLERLSGNGDWLPDIGG